MLTAIKVNSLKPREKPYKTFDGHGLYIEVRPTGAKFWRQKYRYNGKENILSHGKYPIVSLSDARKLRDDALKLLAEGVNPSKAKRQAKTKLRSTFGTLAKEWFDAKKTSWKPTHADKVWEQIEVDLFPYLKDEPTDRISATDLLEVLRKVERRGALSMVSKLRQRCEGIFKYAMLTERVHSNPASPLVGVFQAKAVKHMNALHHKELPEFFDKLNQVSSDPTIKAAIKVIVHTFVRTTELRLTPWSEIDIENRVWEIPSQRMKRKSGEVPI